MIKDGELWQVGIRLQQNFKEIMFIERIYFRGKSDSDNKMR